MLKTRVIPVLFLMNGLIVRSERFVDFKVIGNPYNELERYSDWLADEILYVDITREGVHDLRRSDHKEKGVEDPVELVRAFSYRAQMPVTYGGRVKTVDQATSFISAGADKIVVNTGAYERPALLGEIANRHGSQAAILGIDVKRDTDGTLSIFVDQGRRRVDSDVVGYARRMVDAGAGEILVNSIDRDGTAEGYDLAAIETFAKAVNVPVIVAGGAGMPEHFRQAANAGASAVAAGNIFHFTENAYKNVKSHLRRRGVDIRYPYAR